MASLIAKGSKVEVKNILFDSMRLKVFKILNENKEDGYSIYINLEDLTGTSTYSDFKIIDKFIFNSSLREHRIRKLDQLEANAEAGGTQDFDEFKEQLFNRRLDLLAVDPADYLEVKFGGQKKSIKEAHNFGDMSYDDLDLKESLYKIIEDKTGLGVGALFQEEMNDRRTIST